jgi:hypothetical protein
MTQQLNCQIILTGSSQDIDTFNSNLSSLILNSNGTYDSGTNIISVTCPFDDEIRRNYINALYQINIAKGELSIGITAAISGSPTCTW